MADRFTLREKSRVRYYDTTLLLIILLLMVFGLVMLYSVSAYDGNVNYGDSAYYFKSQLRNSIFGLFIMIGVSVIPYHFWEKTSALVYGFATVMLLLIIPYGKEVNGAKRWLIVPTVNISIQPAEIAKVAAIIIGANIIVRLGKRIETGRGFFYTMVPAGIHFLLIYLVTRNLSSAIIVGGIAFIMSFVSAEGYKKYVYSFAALLIGAAGYVLLVVKTGGIGGFRGERVLAWLDPNAYAAGKGYQTLQALYAIGSGGMMGKGIGESMQKLGYLPEAQNDMIFSIICEELGFVGALCVIAMFLLLLWRCLLIANNAPDLYGALLVIGFMAHIAIQVILNIAVVTNTIPNTGISLPFISYGGSSVVMLLFEVGLVMSVQRSIRVKDVE